MGSAPDPGSPDGSMDPALAGRIRSLFASNVHVTVRAAPRVSPRDVLEPDQPDTVFVWISLGGSRPARIYLAARDGEGHEARYLLREVPLESGLDEIGGETLAQVTHSSVTALWSRQQAVPREDLARELRDEAARQSDPAERQPSRAGPVRTPTERGLARRGAEARRVHASAAPTRPKSWRWIGGAELSGYHSGDEGWLVSPGAFFGMLWSRRWSVRASASVLVPSSFEAGPARVHLEGGASELRGQVAVLGAQRWRLRVDAGAGVQVLWWHAAAAPPATTLGGEREVRGFGLGSVAGEYRVGCCVVAAVRGDVRVPLVRTDYRVLYDGVAKARASAGIAPGLAMEIAVMPPRDPRSSRAR